LQQQLAASSAQPARAAATSGHPEPATQDNQSEQEQLLGTAISWLVDCLVAAVPHQQLALVQLALATAVAECTRLMQQPKTTAADGQGEGHSTAEPAVKRQRLEQQQQQQQAGQEHGTTSNSRGASMQAKQVGLQLLTAVCCCEILQHGSRQLIAPAAVAAAATVAGGGDQAERALQCSSWLCRYLCLQVTAPAPAAAAAGTGASCVAGLQDAAAAVGLQAPSALAELLLQLSNQDPRLVLQLVHIVMGTAAPAAGAAQQAAAASAAFSNAGAGAAHEGFGNKFQQLLAEAAKQWRPLPDTACQGKKPQKGKKSGKGKQQVPQQQHQSGMAAAAAAAQQAPPVPVKQVMPDAPNVSATWVCRHIVPVLLQQAQEQQQALAHQQQPIVEQPTSTATAAGITENLPAVVALAQLLAADRLLLPAAGEVLVSARYLAEALNAVPAGLQEAVAAAWRQQLELRHAAQQRSQGAGPASIVNFSVVAQQQLQQQQQQQATAATELLQWKVLQPMLCLLSHLEQGSPLAQFLGSCVRECISSAGGGNSRVPEVLQHILLPVRFGIKVPGRLWLLQQLLTPGNKQQRSPASGPDAAAQGGDRVAAAVLDCLEQLLQGESQQQLAEGLQLLAQERQDNQQQQQGGKAGAKGAGRDGNAAAAAGTGISLQQTQARDLAAGLLQLAGTLAAGGGSSSAGGTGDADDVGAEAAVILCNAWQQQAAKRLWERLRAAAATAACEVQARPW
jgi:hypothetical protein